VNTAILESFAILISGHDLFVVKMVAKLSCKLLNTSNLIGQYFRGIFSWSS